MQTGSLLVSIDKLVDALEALEFKGVAENNPGCLALRSPFTQAPVVIPMNQGAALPETLVRHILVEEPIDLDRLIAETTEN